MRETKRLPLRSSLAELGKSILPAGLAEEGAYYPFYCSSPEPKAISRWIVDGEAIVMGTGGVATIHHGHGQFSYSTDCWAFTSHNPKLTTDYLYRLLQHRLPRIDYAGFEGSGLRHLRKDFIRDLCPDVPEVPVQRRITRILSAVDESIEQTEALIAKTQQVKAGLMHDLFTRGVTQDGRLRPARDEAPNLYQNSLLGWIPKDWELRACSDICLAVIDCKNRTPPITDDGYAVIRTPNVRAGEFVWSDLVYTDHRSYREWTARGTPQVGDIVITREAPVGEVCMIPSDLPQPCLGQRMMLYRPNPEEVLGNYMLYALQAPRVRKFLDIISGGSTVGHVRVGDIRSLRLPWTNRSEQEMIGAALDASRDSLRHLNSESEKLWRLKMGLTKDLLLGVCAPLAEEQEVVAANV